MRIPITLLAGALCMALLAVAAPVPAQQMVPDARGLVGQWTGSYSCGQGRTGLRLVITDGSGQSFKGSFGFFALPENPGVPSGRYAITGSLNRGTGAIAISAGSWLERPEGYETVNLKGRFNADADLMSGIVDNPNCTNFEVRREIFAGAETPARAFAAAGTAAAALPAAPPPQVGAGSPDPIFSAALHAAFAAAFRRIPSDPLLAPFVACSSVAFAGLAPAEKQRLIDTTSMPQGASRDKALEGWVNRAVQRHPEIEAVIAACG